MSYRGLFLSFQTFSLFFCLSFSLFFREFLLGTLKITQQLCRTSFSLPTPRRLPRSFFLLPDQALDLLVPVSSNCLQPSTSGLSPCRLQGVLLLSNGISLLEGGFTLRCLQRLSLPDLATLPCHWLTAGTPVVRPARSSRTKASSFQISSARAG